MPVKPPAEVDLTTDLVRALLQDQHPDLAALPLRLAAHGWDNATFRLGDDLAVRLPRREAAAHLLEHEQRWLPTLAPLCPVPVPAPVRTGRPSPLFRWSWSVVPWVSGVHVADQPVADRTVWAPELAEALVAVHVPAPAGAPVNPFRGGALAGRAAALKARLDAGHLDVAIAAAAGTGADAAGGDAGTGGVDTTAPGGDAGTRAASTTAPSGDAGTRAADTTAPSGDTDTRAAKTSTTSGGAGTGRTSAGTRPTPADTNAARAAAGTSSARARLDALWRDALLAPAWPGPLVWLHGDPHPGNLVAAGGHLAGLLDFGDMTAGDPACDLATAWLTFDARGRAAFRARADAVADARGPLDPGRWRRAAGWALVMASALVTHGDDDPVIAAAGFHAIGELIRDA
ncbi:phosphotransferase [Cellulosimicrobium cellulans]|uniref:phosphotransferase n=1 Tax=Cellulosimicrobium cellulans TaxID=1710 RepID=UPI00130E6C6E|nr:phosphotransferase [Cellulosimicrobium cellulans]